MNAKEKKDSYFKDSLTGLNNREKLFMDLKSEKEYILAIVNVDKFSEINNTYGEMIGNVVLRELGNKLAAFEMFKNIYRCYGDEFAVLLEYKGESEKQMIDLFILLAKTISEEKIFEDIILEYIHVGVTIGLAYGKRDLYVNSNIAFQVAKKDFKSVVIYNSEIADFKNYNSNHNMQEHQAKAAIAKGEIVSYYQPIYCNTRKKIVKYEALARLRYKNKIIYPNDFIEAAKRAKVYTEITMAMVKKVFEDFKDRDEVVSINIATEDIFNVDIVNRIESALSLYENSSNIVFEITESGKIQCFKTLQEFIKKIKRHGAKISIDDFGTEYSNLTHLSVLNTDYLKIDGQFIKDCHTDSKNYIILEAISQMAKKLNIATVAEYVENKEILKIVCDLGIDYSQGHLFGKAQPLERIKIT